MPLADGTFSVRSEVHKETFHPQVGAQEEARCVYFQPMRLRDRIMAASNSFCVWDIGLGSAGNALNLIRDHQDLESVLDLRSFEITLVPLEFALAQAGKLAYLAGFESFLEQLVHDKQVAFKVGSLRVHWHLYLGDLRNGFNNLPSGCPSPEAVMYDPYSPAKNPELWSLPAFERLRAQISGPATLATYSRSTSVRVAMLLSGFYVGRGGEVGEKEETTVAATDPGLIEALLDVSWLKKIRNSTNGEPMTVVPHTRSYLKPLTWKRLLAHPQFSKLTVDLELPLRQG